jgi:HK97 family phage portal protein
MDVLHSQYITPKISLPGYVVEGYWYNYNASTTYYKSSQILCLKYYNIYNDIVGFAPLQAIFTQETLDNLFDEFSIALLQNGGVPGSIIKYTGKSLKEEEKDKLENQWNKYLKGGQNNGKIKVIGNDFEVVKLGTDPKDMDFIDGRRVTKESILNAFGVPMSFIDPKDSNRSNLEEATYIYQKYTVLPKLQQISDILNKRLVSEFNEPNIYLTYNNPVEQDKKDETDRIYLMLDKGVISVEEARVKLELD